MVRRTLAATTLGIAAIAVWEISRGSLSFDLTRVVGKQLGAVAAYLATPHILDGSALYGFAFLGGLAGSLSPCILGMLPVNLSYIGASGVRSRAAAIRLASTFVAGVAVVNTVLGLTASLFFAVFVQYRAEINITVGAATILMALWLARMVTVRIPGITAMPAAAGPAAAGAAFALAASPCSSPVLIAILGAAAKDAQPLRAVLAMAAYSIGYAGMLWLASVGTGLATVSRRLLPYGELLTRCAAAALGALGTGTVVYGFTLL